MSKQIMIGAIASIALSVAAVGTAGADPINRNSFGPIAVDCPVAGTFDVVAHGNGPFSAAQVLGTTQVLIPLAFADGVFVYTDPDGVSFPPENEPPRTKGSGKQAGEWCSYAFDIDTGNGLENISGSGMVKVKLSAGS